MRKLSRKENEVLDMLSNKYIAMYAWEEYFNDRMYKISHDETNTVKTEFDEKLYQNFRISWAQYDALRKVYKKLIDETLEIYGISQLQRKQYLANLSSQIFKIVAQLEIENWPFDKMVDNYPMWGD